MSRGLGRAGPEGPRRVRGRYPDEHRDDPGRQGTRPGGDRGAGRVRAGRRGHVERLAGWAETRDPPHRWVGSYRDRTCPVITLVCWCRRYRISVRDDDPERVAALRYRSVCGWCETALRLPDAWPGSPPIRVLVERRPTRIPLDLDPPWRRKEAGP